MNKEFDGGLFLKIYTKQGDRGETSLVGGRRVSKSHARLNAYGTVDELNSLTGLLRAHSKDFLDRDRELEIIQHRLFQVGSHLACESDEIRNQLPPFRSDYAEHLESPMDLMTNELPELKNFILPGGSEAASRSHICRTVCRRAERHLFSLEDLAETEEQIGQYLNRLSDYFFVLARWFNMKLKYEDVIWRKDV